MTEPTNALVRYLIERLGVALTDRDGDAAVAILDQIHLINPELADHIFESAIAMFMDQITARLIDAHCRGDHDTITRTLTQIGAIDSHAAVALSQRLASAVN